MSDMERERGRVCVTARAKVNERTNTKEERKKGKTFLEREREILLENAKGVKKKERNCQIKRDKERKDGYKEVSTSVTLA